MYKAPSLHLIFTLQHAQRIFVYKEVICKTCPRINGPNNYYLHAFMDLFPFGQFPLGQFPLRQFHFVNFTSSILTLSIPTLSTLTMWELTKWEVDKVSTVVKAYLQTSHSWDNTFYNAFTPKHVNSHPTNAWVRATQYFTPNQGADRNAPK